MAITDIFKSKKKKAPPSPPPPYSGEAEVKPPSTQSADTALVDYVRSMRNQGYADDQIVDYLKSQGYDINSINNAMAQADVGKTAGPVAQVPGMPPEPVSFKERMTAGMPGAGPGAVPESFEEIAETVVEEKWSDFMKELKKVNEWKDKADSRIDKVEQELEDLKGDVENLHKAIVAKISDYDKNLLDVGTEIKAMEKVFQKVLPELTGSVEELSRITKGIKSKKKKSE